MIIPLFNCIIMGLPVALIILLTLILRVVLKIKNTANSFLEILSKDLIKEKI